MEENIIKLQNGSTIQGYPKQKATVEETKELPMLDTTGEYFSIRKKPTKPQLTEEEERDQQKLFTDNAFLILANRERILRDSRMLLTPLPIRNGLAYSGAFSTATLGVYIEWWMNAPYSVLFDEEDDSMSLVWYVSGSPLSGSNLCSKVTEEGKTETVSVPFFIKLWPKFGDILADYSNPKRLYEAYTLPEVIDILKHETTAEDYAESIKRFHYQAKVALLNAELNSWKDRYKSATDEIDDYRHKWHLALIQSKLDEVKIFYNNYMRKKEAVNTRIEELTKENHNLKKDLRNGLLTNKQYQPMLRKNKQEIEGMKHDIHTFKTEGLASLFPEITVRFGETYLINQAEEKILDEIIEWFDSNTKP